MRLKLFAAAAALAVAPSFALAQTVGVAVEVPAEVGTYVTEEQVPSVRVEREVIVGQPLPEVVELRPIPRFPRYRFAVVNERRVLVEPETRRVLTIID